MGKKASVSKRESLAWKGMQRFTHLSCRMLAQDFQGHITRVPDYNASGISIKDLMPGTAIFFAAAGTQLQMSKEINAFSKNSFLTEQASNLKAIAFRRSLKLNRSIKKV